MQSKQTTAKWINGAGGMATIINLSAKKSTMKKIFLFCAVALLQQAAFANITDSIPANPKDVESVNAIVAAVYDVISGPAGQKRNWDRMRTLFIPEARLIPTGKRQDGSFGKRVMSVEEYITNSGPILERDGFFEREIGRKQEQFGNIVHVFSTYDSKRKLEDEKPFARGINSIQLWNDGSRWWIMTIFWQGENKDQPIPEKYIGTKD